MYRLKVAAIALGVLAWLIPALAQVWMWLRYSSGTPSLGLLWMVTTFGSLLPASVLSIAGAWLWCRATRVEAARPCARRLGFAWIATPACIAALLVVYVAASILFGRMQGPAAA